MIIPLVGNSKPLQPRITRIKKKSETMKTCFKKSFLCLMLFLGCHIMGCGKDNAPPPDTQSQAEDGHSTIMFPDGSTYDGDIKDGAPHGKGMVRFSDGTRYRGQFAAGQMEGRGSLAYPDKSVYKGTFKKGMLCGNGVLTFPDESRYEGFFKDDAYDGQGVWSTPLGITYEGGFKNGKFHGQGKVVLPDGSQFIGRFEDDRFYGFSDAVSDKKDNTRPNDRGISSELAFSVQVGAFVSQSNAKQLAEVLVNKGYEAQVSVMKDFADRSWYTVRLDRSYASLEDAQERAADFTGKENMAATVRPVDSL